MLLHVQHAPLGVRSCVFTGWLALAWLILSLPAPTASAISVGVDLLVGIDGQACPQPSCTAFGGADAASNTPLDLPVAEGDRLSVFVRIDIGLPMNQYQTAISVDAPDSLSFVSADDVSTLGFLIVADPNDTLSDASPGSGDADSNLCDGISCTAPSSNTLYRLVFDVVFGFAQDALRDLTVAVEAIDFDRAEDSLDPARDTASLRLVAVPEPASALLLGLGMLGLGVSQRRRVR